MLDVKGSHDNLNEIPLDCGLYKIVNEKNIQQGDIIEDCIVYQLQKLPEISKGTTKAVYPAEVHDLIVLTQTCDLVQENAEQIVLASIVPMSAIGEINKHYATDKGLEEIRRGYIPSLYMMPACQLENYEREIRIVNFHRTFTLSTSYIDDIVNQNQTRIRLMTPFREQLSQAFARYFMRVGTPQMIPSFR